jgi:hypothetical protein
MKVIGIDPGKTVGMVLYDGSKVIDAAQATGGGALLMVRDFTADWIRNDGVEAVVIEWPRIYSKAGNEVADTCIQAGMLWWMLGARGLPYKEEGAQWSYQKGVHLHVLTRQQIVKGLSEKMGQSVKTDAGVWAALVDLHGGKGVADKRTTKTERGGPLAELCGRPHARAALAAAYLISHAKS